ncbi:MAG: DUF192 domain-containing protein [Dehalococcoidia bacterium]|nr:DUF192 domain-containing protein [Dehalococcoidia bacterium]
MLSGLLAFVLFLVAVACDGSAATPTPAPGTPTPTPVATLPPGVVTPVPFNLPTVTLSIETANGATKKQVRAEVASNDAERQRGLMFRASLPADTGMLFLFPRDLQGGFWMENTYVPLTIAYLDKDGVIVSMKDGKPLDRTVLQPPVPYRMVLEMEQGWFERNGFAIGSIVRVPASGLPTPK